MVDDSNTETQEDRLRSKADWIALAKQNFDLIMRVRMHGPFKMEKALCDHFGVSEGSLTIENLERLGHACKTGDTSRGSTYVDKGFLYGSTLYRAESGNYIASYKFMCKN